MPVLAWIAALVHRDIGEHHAIVPRKISELATAVFAAVCIDSRVFKARLEHAGEAREPVIMIDPRGHCEAEGSTVNPGELSERRAIEGFQTGVLTRVVASALHAHPLAQRHHFHGAMAIMSGPANRAHRIRRQRELLVQGRFASD